MPPRKGHTLLKVPETDEELVELLKLDKHTTIEGNVAEIFTEAQLVEPVLGDRLSRFSWWFHSEKWGEYMASAVSELGAETWPQLPPYEHQIGRAVRDAVTGLRIVTFKNCAFRANDVAQDRIKKECRLLEQHDMTTLAPNSERNPERVEKASKKLAEHGLLRQVGLQRLYANFFAPDSAMWDIDCIGIYRDRVIAFDYKHKYPDKDEKLGANDAISRLYRHLDRRGILVIYITLNKPVKNPSQSAVDMLDTESPSWYVCNARIFSESDTVMPNRRGTAYNGGTPKSSKGVRLEQLTLVRTADEFRQFLDTCIDSDSR